MSEWWTYRPSDFLLFSPRVYYRLIELHNVALWPSHLLALAFGLALIAALCRGRHAEGRVVLAGLGLLWLFVAWAFLWTRYATINWSASYATIICGLQGAALLAAAMLARAPLAYPRGRLRTVGGLALLTLGVVLYPLGALASGRGWDAAETFGLLPDPTAIGTLGALLFLRPSLALAVAPLPLLWCLFSGMTLWTMGASEAFVLFAAAFGWIAVAIASKARTGS